MRLFNYGCIVKKIQWIIAKPRVVASSCYNLFFFYFAYFYMFNVVYVPMLVGIDHPMPYTAPEIDETLPLKLG